MLLILALGHALVAGPATSTRAPPRPSTVVAAEPEVAQSALDLTPAERARTCASLGVKHGAALSTQTDKLGGAALCTFAEYVLDGDGAPVLLLDARRAEHSKNLQADPRCSLLLQARDLDDRAAAVARVTIAGTATPVPKSAPDRVVLETQFGVRRGVELNRPAPSTRRWPVFVSKLCTTQVAHPYADALLEDGRFDLWRVEPSEIFYVGGFGVGTTWVDKDDYTEAKPDAVAHEAVGLCKTLNGDKHAQDRSTIASTLLGLDDATTTLRVDGVDRLGLEVRVKTADSTDEYRIGFRVPARTVEDAKSEINKLFQEAWELEQGVEYAGAYEDKPAVLKRASEPDP